MKFKLWALLAMMFCALQTHASDHADPLTMMFKPDPEKGISGLFVFPDGDNLVVIFNIHPGLSPLHDDHYDLGNMEKYQYTVHFDLESKVNFNNEQFNVRYGGDINEPGKIKSTASFTYKITNDGKQGGFTTAGALEGAKGVTTHVGIHDDPFIFPRFFGKNVVATVTKIPMSSFPAGQENFIVWGGVYKGKKKQDHVGRSNRTMQPRLDFLNKLEPHKHLAEIRDRYDDPGFFSRIIMMAAQPLFAIRDYDKFPDVIIYNTRRPLGFPNGRRLTDDVAKLTCEYGDCLLWELSYGDVQIDDWPRKTTNDKPFSSTFPYLASPW